MLYLIILIILGSTMLVIKKAQILPENISDTIADAQAVVEAQVEIVTSGIPYQEFFIASGEKHGLPPSVLASICYRESRFGKALDANLMGDKGHGRGLMQIDDRTYTDWLMNNNWQDPAINIDKGAEILRWGYDYALSHGIPESDALQVACATYNHGPGAVSDYKSGNVDKNTTNHNYSSDVIASSQNYSELNNA